MVHEVTPVESGEVDTEDDGSSRNVTPMELEDVDTEDDGSRARDSEQIDVSNLNIYRVSFDDNIFLAL